MGRAEVSQRPPRSSVRKASRKRLTCLSMMTGEKPRTRRAPGSTLGSGRQGGLRTPQEGSFSYPHSITSPHLNDVGFPCQEGLPGAAPTQDLDKVSMAGKRRQACHTESQGGASGVGLRPSGRAQPQDVERAGRGLARQHPPGGQQ